VQLALAAHQVVQEAAELQLAVADLARERR